MASLREHFDGPARLLLFSRGEERERQFVLVATEQDVDAVPDVRFAAPQVYAGEPGAISNVTAVE